MQRVFDEYDNWVGGVSTSASADSLPAGYSPRGHNAVLQSIGGGTATVGQRKGVETGNVTPLTGSPAVLGQYQFRRLDGSSFHLLVSDGGRLDKYNADTTTSTINATAFTAGTHYPAFASANNLCFIANGADVKKTDGTTVFNWGMVRPAAPTAAAASGGSMAIATWDVALTYFNSLTGQESSLSDFTSVATSGSNLKINISWAVPTDPQVTHVRVYMRNQTLGPNVYLVVAGLTPAPDATWFGFVPATTATVADISLTVFGAFKLLAPTTSSNNPPTAGWQFPVWHKSRMFLFDSGNAYYSQIQNLASFPESFDTLNNIQPISPNDGDTIVGAVSCFDVLFIFKKFSVWKIDGSDPTSWIVSRVSATHGLASNRAIVQAAGVLYWWTNGSMGLVALSDAASEPLEIGKELISATVADDMLNNVNLASVCAAADESNEHVLFALPEVGNTRNTLVLPFNYRLKRFASDLWNPMDVSSFGVVETASANRVVYMGGYAGQIFKWDVGANDGVPVTTTITGNVTSATGSTLTDSTAAFSTAGGKLIERYVYVVSSDGFTIQRRRITTNTATQLTVTPAWTTNPNASAAYVVGGIDFQWDTPWGKSGAAFLKKRYEFAFLEGNSPDSGVAIGLYIFTDGDDVTPKKTRIYAVPNSSGVYDASVYDTATYASQTEHTTRQRVGLVGKSYRLRVRHLQANKAFNLTKLAMQGSSLSSRT